MKTCECGAAAVVRGRCKRCYNRWYHSDGGRSQIAAAPPVDYEERFWSYVDKSGECWLWTRASVGGYGWFYWPGRTRVAHRLAYECTVGPVPTGLQLDHLCRNRACVNPDHLEPVTQRENLVRGVGMSARNAAKAECIRGHPFSPENTRITPEGRRECRECRRVRGAARRARLRSARD